MQRTREKWGTRLQRMENRERYGGSRGAGFIDDANNISERNGIFRFDLHELTLAVHKSRQCTLEFRQGYLPVVHGHC